MTISSFNAITADNELLYLPSSQTNIHGKFTNAAGDAEYGVSQTLRMIKRFLFEKKQNAFPDRTIPLEELNKQKLMQLSDEGFSVVRLGHSTILMKIEKRFWLIDPVFSERASPFSFMGPKRFHQPPIDISDLPEIEGVIISHNHYDHLDETSIRQLADKVNRFIMPLGNSAQVIDWGVDESKITELDWWQKVTVDNLEIIATPAQHFSGRGLSDKNKTLWSSWVFKLPTSSIFFSGDSGYFDGFKTIGNKYGPFDLTMIETGAYDKDWPEVHMTPAESAMAHIDLKGKKMLPVHNGTFDLAFHAWTDPFEQIVAIAGNEWIDLLTPKMGQVVSLENDESVDKARDLYWWR